MAFSAPPTRQLAVTVLISSRSRDRPSFNIVRDIFSDFFSKRSENCIRKFIPSKKETNLVFVNLKSTENARQAISKLDGYKFRDVTLKVSYRWPTKTVRIDAPNDFTWNEEDVECAMQLLVEYLHVNTLNVEPSPRQKSFFIHFDTKNDASHIVEKYQSNTIKFKEVYWHLELEFVTDQERPTTRTSSTPSTSSRNSDNRNYGSPHFSPATDTKGKISLPPTPSASPPITPDKSMDEKRGKKRKSSSPPSKDNDSSSSHSSSSRSSSKSPRESSPKVRSRSPSIERSPTKQKSQNNATADHQRHTMDETSSPITPSSQVLHSQEIRSELQVHDQQMQSPPSSSQEAQLEQRLYPQNPTSRLSQQSPTPAFTKQSSSDSSISLPNDETSPSIVLQTSLKSHLSDAKSLDSTFSFPTTSHSFSPSATASTPQKPPKDIHVGAFCGLDDCWNHIFCEQCIKSKKVVCEVCLTLWNSLIREDGSEPTKYQLRCSRHCVKCSTCLQPNRDNSLQKCAQCDEKLCSNCGRCSISSPNCSLKNGSVWCNGCWAKHSNLDQIPYQCTSCVQYATCSGCYKQKDDIQERDCDGCVGHHILRLCKECLEKNSNGKRCKRYDTCKQNVILCNRCIEANTTSKSAVTAYPPSASGFYCQKCADKCNKCTNRIIEKHAIQCGKCNNVLCLDCIDEFDGYSRILGSAQIINYSKGCMICVQK